LAAGRHLAGLKIGDKPLRIVLPAAVDICLDPGVVDVFAEHGQQVILPFAVHQVVGDKPHIFPGALVRQAARSHQDVEMRVVLARTAIGLQDDHAADVQRLARDGAEDVLQTGKAGSHQFAQEVRIPVEPVAEKVGGGQDEVAIGDAGEETPGKRRRGRDAGEETPGKRRRPMKSAHCVMRGRAQERQKDDLHENAIRRFSPQ
jgi:hypothetical protein